MQCFAMTENSWHGYWWVAGLDEHSVPGTLFVEESGQTRLAILGSLDVEDAPKFADSDGNFEPPTILGLAGAVKITLIGGLPTLSHGFPGDVSYQEISGSRALVGTHISRASDAAFSSVMLTLENLGSFLGRQAFDRTGDQSEGRDSVIYAPDEKIEFSIDNWKFQVITYSPGFRNREERGSSVLETFTEEYLIATSDVPRPIGDFDEMTMTFMDLLTLASGEGSGMIDMRLELAKNPDENYAPGDGRSYRVVQQYGPRIHTARPHDLPQQSGRFRFTCADMSFENITRAWLPLREGAISAMNLLFGLYYSRPGFTETRLLSAAVVAESMSVSIIGNPPKWNSDEFKSLRTALSSIGHSAQRGWVKERVKNEISYKERLIKLAERPDQAATIALLGDTDTWARRLVNARNGLAHTGADSKKSGDIFELTEVTLFLVALVLMAEIGFGGEVQLEAYRRDEFLSVIRGKRLD
jgi:hypothetical protein